MRARHAAQQSAGVATPASSASTCPVGMRSPKAKQPLPSALELGGMSQPLADNTGVSSLGCSSGRARALGRGWQLCGG